VNDLYNAHTSHLRSDDDGAEDAAKYVFVSMLCTSVCTYGIDRNGGGGRVMLRICVYSPFGQANSRADLRIAEILMRSIAY
jgi:hypothetical protein